MGEVTAVCVVHELGPNPWRPVGVTAIDKRPVGGAVHAGRPGLDGDRQCDTKVHGGPYQAVYAYADEDAAWWAERLGREVPPGLFGENLRTSGVEVTGAEIGERWRVGGALLEVTSARIPCRTFAEKMDERHWVKRFGDARRPGAYLKVLEEGDLERGVPVEVVHRPGHGVTVADTDAAKDPRTMAHLLDAAARLGIDLNPRLVRAARRTAARV